jgi:TPR repeat protein
MNMKTSFLTYVLAGLCAASIGFAQSAGIDPALLAKANAGDQAAEVAVGEKYDAGVDVPQDLKQAADWYRKAAEKGSVAGEVHLAELYLAGRGVARDKAQAAELYRKAAEQGDAGAQGTLAMLYVMGQGVQQSDVEAYYWLDLAAAVKTAKQDQYIANRQNVGTRITVEELQAVQERVAKWKAAHPR